MTGNGEDGPEGRLVTRPSGKIGGQSTCSTLSQAVKAPIPLYRVKNPFTALACSTLFPPPFFPLLFSPRAVIPFPIAPFLSPLFRGSLWANLNGEPWSRLHLHLRMGRRDREGAGDEQRRKRDECGLHGGLL